MKIGIIGAGIAGLATAVRLASKGYEVTVFEANTYAGGKLSVFELEGADAGRRYRFDAGPSLFTMPMYVEDLFKAANEPIAPYFSYEKLDIVCQYFWDDGTKMTAWADSEKLAQEIENQLGVPREKVKKAFKSAANKYDTAGRIFLEKSLHKIRTWLTPQVAKAMLLMPTFDIFSTMHNTHRRLSANNTKLTQFLDRYATYNGSNPYRASGMLSVIPHLEHGIGAFYPKGGMYEITKAVFELAKKKGVTFHFGQKVTEILVNKGQIVGLKTDVPYHFDKVVSNMDVYFTYKKLLPNMPHPEKTLSQERSSSGLIFYWGIKKTFPQLDLHNIFFSNDYKHEFDTLAAGNISDDPTIYANITSKRTPTDAPEGCENWFVLINAPFNDGSQDWETIINRTRENVIKKLSKVLGVDFQKLIEIEDILSPLSIEQKTSSYAGSLYGTSSNAMMSAFLRHPNFSAATPNLYFVGGSVHPGGGIPLALLSAKITSDFF